MQIKDSVVIVTGASEGIGLAIVRKLSRRGAKVVLAARSADKLAQLEKIRWVKGILHDRKTIPVFRWILRK